MSTRHEFIVASEMPPTTEHVIDGFNKGGMFETYEHFDVSGDAPEMRAAYDRREAQKAGFLAGEITNPILNDCPNFQVARVTRRDLYLETRALFEAQTLRYANGEPATPEDRLLDDMIATRINEIGYVETAALIAEGNLTASERSAAAAVLKQAGRDIYGMPDRNRGLSLIADRRQKAVAIAADESHPLFAVASELLDRTLPDEPDMPIPGAKLSDETVEYYRRLMDEELSEAVQYAYEEIGQKDHYSVAEMKQIYDRYLHARGYDDAGWSAEIVPNRTACATKASTQKVEIGEKRLASKLTSDAVLETLIHEVEVHVGSQVRGMKLGSKLLEFGLAGFGGFHEALASTSAAAYIKKSKETGMAYTMALALAAGYDSGQERDFRETFEAVWRLNIVQSYKADKPLDEQIVKAQNAAYNNLVRVWRGMPTDIPGCVYPKDKMYDSTMVVRELENGGRPLPRPEFLRLLSAKYDPTNPAQDAYVRSVMPDSIFAQ